MKNNLIPFFLLSLIFIFGACQSGYLYEEYRDVKSDKWHQDSSFYFDVMVDDTALLTDVFISIRNQNNYPYRNLILFTKVRSPQGNLLKDTVNILLADEKGRWYGKGVGGYWTYDVKYKNSVRFPVEGVYRFTFKHGMRVKELPGVKGVGLQIKKKDLSRGEE